MTRDHVRIRRYYDATTTSSYLRSWAGPSLALHLGLDADGSAEGHELSLYHTNYELARRAAVGPDSVVVDAGCGVGSFTLWAAGALGALTIGVNITPSQLDIARQLADERGLTALARFVLGDFAALPLRDRSCDAVVMLESLCHARDPAACLAQARRVLRPGGRFACIDVFRGRSGGHFDFDEMVRGTVLGEVRARDELAELTTRAGFVQVEDEDLTARVLTSARRMARLATQRLAYLEFRRLLLGLADELYEAHTHGALGAARGLEGGSVTYGYVGGVAP